MDQVRRESDLIRRRTEGNCGEWDMERDDEKVTQLGKDNFVSKILG